MCRESKNEINCNNLDALSETVTRDSQKNRGEIIVKGNQKPNRSTQNKGAGYYRKYTRINIYMYKYQ